MPGPKYPNQQLRSVSLEAFFSGRLDAFTAFGRVQALHAERLPNLFVPNLQPGDAAGLRPFQLRDAAGRESLALALNQVTFVSFDYQGYEQFAMDATKLVGSALDALGSPRLNRLVYRYENELGLAKNPDGSIPIERVFPGLRPNSLPGLCRALDAQYDHLWTADLQRGGVGYQARLDTEGVGEVLRVSVFASVEALDGSPGVVPERIVEACAEAHRRAHELFEAIISDEFRTFISAPKGES